MEPIKKLLNLRKELNECILERHEEIDGLLVALLAKEHALLLGPPGTAKSMLINKLCSAIEDGKHFQWLLTKFSTPDELFGSVSLDSIEKGLYTRITKNKMPEAHLVFLDEIFKANSAILNSILEMINERIFRNNGPTDNVPLISCVGASNELPQGKELNALYDRFMFRFWVNPIQSDENFLKILLRKTKDKIETSLTFDDINGLQEICKQVKVDEEVVLLIREIQNELKLKGITASCRRWDKSVDILKAYAVLNEKDKVTSEELLPLSHILWNTPDEKGTIDKVVIPKVNPLNLLAIEFEDAATEAYSVWKNRKSSGGSEEEITIQSIRVCKEIVEKIQEVTKGKSKEQSSKLCSLESQIRQYHKEMLSEI